MLTLKTDKSTRHYCDRCRSQLTVQVATHELFFAVCPKGGQNHHVRTEDPLLKWTECPSCKKVFKVSLYVLGDIERGAVVSCTCGEALAPGNGRSDLVQEALRIFGQGVRVNRDLANDRTGVGRPGVIIRCPTCRCLNRISELSNRRRGFYSCGRCKRSLVTESR